VKRTRLCAGLCAAALCAGQAAPRSAYAAKTIVVSEDRIAVSPPDAEGFSTVHGPPGCVIVGPNAVAAFLMENTKIKPKRQVQGKVHTDGSFTARIPARTDDKLQIRFSSSDGGSVKVPKRVPLETRAPAQRLSRSISSQPARQQASLAAPVPRPTPEIVIRYTSPGEKASPEERMEDEVLHSGVLPPPL